jgi:hypothetical protein
MRLPCFIYDHDVHKKAGAWPDLCGSIKESLEHGPARVGSGKRGKPDTTASLHPACVQLLAIVHMLS